MASSTSSLGRSSSFIITPLQPTQLCTPRTSRLVMGCLEQIEMAAKLAGSGDPKSKPKAYQIIRALQDKYPDQKEYFANIMDKLFQKALTSEERGMKRAREGAPMAASKKLPPHPPLNLVAPLMNPPHFYILPLVEEPAQERPLKRPRLEGPLEAVEKSASRNTLRALILGQRNNWKEIKKLLMEDPSLFSVKIGDISDTILHVFVRERSSDECRKLLALWEKEGKPFLLISEKNREDHSALDLAGKCKNKWEKSNKIRLLQALVAQPILVTDAIVIR